MWRSLPLGILTVIFLLSFPVLAQRYPTQPTDNQNSDTGRPNNSGSGLLDVGIILNLIRTLTPSPSSTQANIDSCDLSDVRSSIGRLYLILANQYLIQNQLTSACEALDSAYTSQLESYTCRRLPPNNNLSKEGSKGDCHANELQQISQLTGSRTALIYPVVFKDRVEILLVPPASSSLNSSLSNPNLAAAKQLKFTQANSSNQPIHKVVYDASPENVNSTILELRNSLSDRNVLDNSYLPSSQKLYNWIIRPIENDLAAAKIETLVFVMDGDLRVVPPAAFHDGKQFLVEKYASVSVTAMPLTNVEKRDRAITPQILAMGLSESVQGFTPLPAAKTEVETITSQVLKGNAFLNQDFTIDNLQNQYGQKPYTIVHLATHAEFIAKKFSDSFIQFWNGRLTLNQIPDMKLTADMLTLSACQTAVGQNMGISGIAVRSGAKSVLASLWSVSDLGTTPLMLSFYSNFSEAASKAIALRNAQLSLLRGQVKIVNNQIQGVKGLANTQLNLEKNHTLNLNHPFYWSAFVLVGNWL